mmetsp:Transcript_108781/g.318256  ORF Transcript_108781/g.318256 Transcript_108781/m.318256 type:complete len:184 (+) Transcript_108781:89-640(+)
MCPSVLTVTSIGHAYRKSWDDVRATIHCRKSAGATGDDREKLILLIKVAATRLALPALRDGLTSKLFSLAPLPELLTDWLELSSSEPRRHSLPEPRNHEWLVLCLLPPGRRCIRDLAISLCQISSNRSSPLSVSMYHSCDALLADLMTRERTDMSWQPVAANPSLRAKSIRLCNVATHGISVK